MDLPGEARGDERGMDRVFRRVDDHGRISPRRGLKEESLGLGAQGLQSRRNALNPTRGVAPQDLRNPQRPGGL